MAIVAASCHSPGLSYFQWFVTVLATLFVNMPPQLSVERQVFDELCGGCVAEAGDIADAILKSLAGIEQVGHPKGEIRGPFSRCA